MTFYDMPDSWLERARLLENVMRESCTGGERDEPMYSALRSEFMQDDQLKALLPEMVRTNRTLASLWGELGEIAGYKGRRKHLNDAFTPIIDHLEGANRAPLDVVAGDALSTFDSDGVHTVWTKALARRTTDPEGAITMARTLLETVCKRVLDERNETYDDRADLPDLYKAVATSLNLAPDQHTEAPIKAILGGAMNLVNGLGTLRNRLSDSHGRGGKIPVKPSQRHASLAVNMAGALAAFIVETHQEKAAT
nr:abortive infection family protein [Methylobacterium sp. ZNC0032]